MTTTCLAAIHDAQALRLFTGEIAWPYTLEIIVFITFIFCCQYQCSKSHRGLLSPLILWIHDAVVMVREAQQELLQAKGTV